MVDFNPSIDLSAGSFTDYQKKVETKNELNSTQVEVERAKKLNIDYLERIDPSCQQEILKNREDLSLVDKTQKPVAVVIFTKEDGVNAFKGKEIVDLIKNGYHVIYFEAREDTDVYAAIEAVGKHKKIDCLVIGGHGTRTAVNMGDPPKFSDSPKEAAHEITELYSPLTAENEKYYVDISDKEEMKAKNLQQYVCDDAIILSLSCSTGNGKDSKDNLANAYSEAFPGRTVIAPAEPVGHGVFVYDKKTGRVVDVKFSTPDHGIHRISSFKKITLPDGKVVVGAGLSYDKVTGSINGVAKLKDALVVDINAGFCEKQTKSFPVKSLYYSSKNKVQLIVLAKELEVTLKSGNKITVPAGSEIEFDDNGEIVRINEHNSAQPLYTKTYSGEADDYSRKLLGL